MNQIHARVGNFTSSEIVALTTNGKTKGSMGKPAYTYIDECNMERRLGMSISTDVYARPLVWGKVGEVWGFAQLGLEYTLSSKETLRHPEFSCWSGSPDGEKMINQYKCVAEIKCPMTRKSFCELVDAIQFPNPIEYIRKNHRDGEKFYWQIVSNAILQGAKFGELIIIMPYRSQLEEVREIARNWEDPIEQRAMYWLHAADDNELPYLPDGGYYKNINRILFEIPAADKAFLEERVSLASNELVEYHVIKDEQ